MITVEQRPDNQTFIPLPPQETEQRKLGPLSVHKESGIIVMQGTAYQLFPGTSPYHVMMTTLDAQKKGLLASNPELKAGIGPTRRVGSVVSEIRSYLFDEEDVDSKALISIGHGKPATYAITLPFQFIDDEELDSIAIRDIKFRPNTPRFTQESKPKTEPFTPPNIQVISERFGLIKINDNMIMIPQGVQLAIMKELLHNPQQAYPTALLDEIARGFGSKAERPTAFAIRHLRPLLGVHPDVITSQNKRSAPSYKLNAIVEQRKRVKPHDLSHGQAAILGHLLKYRDGISIYSHGNSHTFKLTDSEKGILERVIEKGRISDSQSTPSMINFDRADALTNTKLLLALPPEELLAYFERQQDSDIKDLITVLYLKHTKGPLKGKIDTFLSTHYLTRTHINLVPGEPVTPERYWQDLHE